MRTRWLGWVLMGAVTAGVGRGMVLAQAAAPAPAADAELEKMHKQMADWAQLGRYREANAALPARTPGRVVFYGDSITDNWAGKRFSSAFFPGKPYLGRGISGQTTAQMVVRFRQDVIDLHPEAVVILAGTNDVAGNTGPMTPEMTEENWETMAELAKAHGIRVIFSSILPAADFPWHKGLDPAPKIRELNAWLKDYCAKQGFTYVDYYSAMADAAGGMKEGISLDGVHPNVAGYEIMEPLAERAIEGK